MIKIAICDDCEWMRTETRKHLLKYSFQRDFDYSLDEYDTGEKLLASDQSYDLIFMDYQFEETGADGITIARALRKKGVSATIIFLSGYPEAVFESFEVGTFRFLIKPIDEQRFTDAIDSFISGMKEADEVLTVRADGMTHFIKTPSIACIEGVGKHCLIQFADGAAQMECPETLAAVEEQLPAGSFYRCHKSYVVNLRHVTSYSHTEVLLDSGHRVPISRTKYRDFTDRYSDFLLAQRR